MTRRGMVASLAVAVVASAQTVRAQQPVFRPTELPELAEPPRLRVLRTETAADCPDADALAASVGQHLGRPALETGEGGSEALGFDVHFSRDDQGYVGLILRRGTRGSERRLADPGTSCAGLAEALAVTLAILVDEAPPPTPRTAEGLGVGRDIRRPPPSPPRPPPEERSFGIAVLAEGVGTMGALDGAWPGFAGEAELTIRPFWFGMGIVHLPTQEYDLPEKTARNATIDLTLTTGTARGCVGFEEPTWRLGGCGLFALGARKAASEGLTSDGSTVKAWLAAGAMALARLQMVGPVHLSARAGVLVPLQRNQVAPANRPDLVLYETSPLAGFVGLGLAVSIW